MRQWSLSASRSFGRRSKLLKAPLSHRDVWPSETGLPLNGNNRVCEERAPPLLNPPPPSSPTHPLHISFLTKGEKRGEIKKEEKISGPPLRRRLPLIPSERLILYDSCSRLSFPPFIAAGGADRFVFRSPDYNRNYCCALFPFRHQWRLRTLPSRRSRLGPETTRAAYLSSGPPHPNPPTHTHTLLHPPSLPEQITDSLLEIQ